MSATDRSALLDSFSVALDSRRDMGSVERIIGHGVVEVFGPDGELKQSVPFTNLVTDFGDEYYTRRGAGVAPPAAATGMQLGTGGGTAAAKNGAGSAIVTLVASSLVAFSTGFPTAATLGAGLGWRAQYKTEWAAGVATATGINEVVVTNQATATQTAAPAGATVSRAVLATAVNKAEGDTLAITWNHDFKGA